MQLGQQEVGCVCVLGRTGAAKAAAGHLHPAGHDTWLSGVFTWNPGLLGTSIPSCLMMRFPCWSPKGGLCSQRNVPPTAMPWPTPVHPTTNHHGEAGTTGSNGQRLKGAWRVRMGQGKGGGRRRASGLGHRCLNKMATLPPTPAPAGGFAGSQHLGPFKALPKPCPSIPSAHWMTHLSLSRAWPSRRTLALMYLRSLLTLGRRAKGETIP